MKTATVKKSIGGAVDADWVTNTCAVRMSRGLNYSKLPVPAAFSGMHTVKGADGKHYAFRVRELRLWLPKATALGAGLRDHEEGRASISTRPP